MNTMEFGAALKALKEGKKVTRQGWRDGLWIVLVTALDYQLNNPTDDIGYDGNKFRDFIGLKAHDGSFGTCGLHDRDVLAEDWVIVE